MCAAVRACGHADDGRTALAGAYVWHGLCARYPMSVGCTDHASCGRHCERDVSDSDPDIVLPLVLFAMCNPCYCPVLSGLILYALLILPFLSVCASP